MEEVKVFPKDDRLYMTSKGDNYIGKMGRAAIDETQAVNVARQYLTGNNKTGSVIYDDLTRKLGSKMKASKYLDSIGIKGMNYLDQASRGVGHGTQNVVVFDDAIIDVLERTHNKIPIDK